MGRPRLSQNPIILVLQLAGIVLLAMALIYVFGYLATPEGVR